MKLCSSNAIDLHSALAWIGTVVGANDVRPLAECSNAGVCDRKYGICSCFPNFEGIACERTVCPNDCSNGGVCYFQSQLAADAGRVYSSPWDAGRQVGCVCDLARKYEACSMVSRYCIISHNLIISLRGPDCSLYSCPSGPDPLKGPGAESGRECSGRGLCDSSSGNCACFAGHYGDACQYQVRRCPSFSCFVPFLIILCRSVYISSSHQWSVSL